MSNVIVTGGSGFLATEFLKKYSKKNIYLISRKKLKNNKKYKTIICDLKNKSKLIKILKEINPTEIYHFAWNGIPKFDKKNFLKNKIISKNLIVGINQIDCKKLIISGSGAEYGFTKKINFENTKPSKKITSLGKQKNFIRKLFFDNVSKKTVIIWARIFFVYGKNQRNGSLLKRLIWAKKNKTLLVLKYPNISNDYIYIKDVIDGILKLKKLNKTQIVNICSSKSISNYDFVKNFERVNKTKILKKDSTNNLKQIYLGSNKKLKKLGWVQKYSLVRALNEICR
jgi:nucleoside-diphosphate-sugar epimerase